MKLLVELYLKHPYIKLAIINVFACVCACISETYDIIKCELNLINQGDDVAKAMTPHLPCVLPTQY